MVVASFERTLPTFCSQGVSQIKRIDSQSSFKASNPGHEPYLLRICPSFFGYVSASCLNHRLCQVGLCICKSEVLHANLCAPIPYSF
jgi:hypothetical protein